MKRTIALLSVVLVIPVLVAGQSQSKQPNSNPTETNLNGSTVVRDRVVGSNRANHVEKPPANTDPVVGSSPQVKQSVTQPRWGNTTVQTPPVAKQATPESTTRKLVQQTSLIPEKPKTVSNTSTAAALTGRSPIPTGVYQVGVGDVLDIRLSNLPTRESTLFTVFKGGLLEYPLLSAPLSVAGLTTDEIARLLSNEIKVIKTARVSVNVRDYASHAVVVTGLVDSPGRKTMRREAMPLFAVLAEALPRPEASMAQLVRGGKTQTIALKDDTAMATLVLPGDLIKIAGGTNAAARFVYVGGDIASRGEKEFRDGMTLTQAILSAGGTSRGTRITVKVARRDTSGFLRSNEYNLQSIEEGKSKDPLLEPGDRIEVTRSM